jgi:hypothetical protein
MTSLNAKEEVFVQRMLSSPDLENFGFDALTRRGKARRFFEPLRASGLFKPERNPIPVREGDRIRVPHWRALDYLVALAKEQQHQDDRELAVGIMDIVREVSRSKNADGTITSNGSTWRVFAELLGLIPLSALVADDLDLITVWLDEPSDGGLIVQAIDRGLLPRLLLSDRPEDAGRAATVFDHCTRIRITENGRSRGKAVQTVADAYWVSELVDHHSRTLGRRAGAAAAPIASQRLCLAFQTTSTHRSYSYGYRSAVEEHEQNRDWHEAENIVVSALRDVLLGWCDGGSAESNEFVLRLLREGTEIQRRVALHVVDEKWNHFGGGDVLAPEVFQTGHLHELYRLLTSHFSSFMPDEKDAVIRNVKGAMPDSRSDDARAHFQASVLHAIAGRGFAPADELLAEIEDHFPDLRGAETHWDFHTYMQTRSGPGPSPFSPQELVAFAEDGKFRERVESFEEVDRWSGPTLDGLIDAIKAASQATPQVFVSLLPDLSEARYHVLYAVLFGIKASWEANSPDRKDEWEDRWSPIFECFGRLATRAQQPEEDLTSARRFVPTRDDVTSLIADFLIATTRNDSRLYPEAFVLRAWEVLVRLLQASGRADKIGEDPVQEAINRPAGRVIEAMFSHVLRLIRKADRDGKSHDSEWTMLRGVFESELRACNDANFEMSTVCGMYLAQLLYVDPSWTDEWMPVLFPPTHRRNFASAAAGIAYTSNSWQVYEMLAKHGVVDEVLRCRDLPGRSTRESILGRMAGAFAHGMEEIDSPPFAFLFAQDQAGDLQVVANTLAALADSQGRERYAGPLMLFWRSCVEWSHKRENASGDLLATLARFSAILDCMDDATRPLLLASAPYVDVGIDIHGLVNSLGRFVESDADGVVEVLRSAVTARRPTFDYEGKLRKLLTELVRMGKRADVFSLMDDLDLIPGMTEFYRELTEGHEPRGD